MSDSAQNSKRVKTAQQLNELPNCLLSLVFGCLSWQAKLTVLNLVSQSWRRTRAAWTSLTIHTDAYTARTKEQTLTILKTAQAPVLRELTLHNVPSVEFLSDVLAQTHQLEHLTYHSVLNSVSLGNLVKILQVRQHTAKRPLDLSLHLFGEECAFQELAAVANVRGLCLREIDSDAWCQTLGPTITNLEVHASITTLDFLRYLPSLCVLDLTRASEINDEHLLALVRHVPRLHSLNLSRCARVTDHGVATVLAQLKQLVHINLGLTLLTENFLDHLTRDRPNDTLRTMNLDGSQLRLKTLDWDLRFTRLESLNLTRCNVQDDDLVFLRGLRTLQHLDLSGNAALEGTGFVYLQKIPLRSLNLTWCLSLCELDQLCIPSLRTLTLDSVRMKNFVGKDRRFAICLQGVLGLEELSLAHTETRNTYLTEFLVLTQLRKLNLRGCVALPDGVHKTLTQFPRLAELCIKRTRLKHATQQLLREQYELF